MKCLERDRKIVTALPRPRDRFAQLARWRAGQRETAFFYASIATRIRRNQGLVYAILVALGGSVLSLH